jgi:uncharacterized protein YigE (DUF2233 family)
MPDLRAALLALALPATAHAACHDTRFDSTPYTVCEVGTGDGLRLWWRADDGLPVATFGRLSDMLARHGQHFGFAMNAGMFAPDLHPLGLTVIDGVTVHPLVTRASSGNFGMLPNGVFCIAADRFAVIETKTYAAAPPRCRYATQSGPMLVIAGALHPKFRPESGSTYIRNGVGVSADGQRAVFAISDVPVTFLAFARFFRDGLGLPDALFLDGHTSRLAAPELKRTDPGFPMGPILGTVVDGPAPGG